MSDFWDIGGVIICLMIGAVSLFGILTCNDALIDDRGDAGQLCYPNLTCDDGFTCFDLGDEDYECRAEIKPVIKVVGE